MEKSEEEQLLIRAMVWRAIEKVEEAKETMEYWQNHCKHPSTEKKHVRVDGYGEKPEFYTNFKCFDCQKRWTEEGSL